MKLDLTTCISGIHFCHQARKKAETVCQLTVEIAGMTSKNNFHFFRQSFDVWLWRIIVYNCFGRSLHQLRGTIMSNRNECLGLTDTHLEYK